MDIKYKNDTKFLGLYLTEDVKWDVHKKHVSDILNKSCYVIQSLKTVTSISILRSVYFANFHSHLRYGILFGGGDPQWIKIFKLQKKVVRLICNVKRKTSCRELFRTLNILPVPCVYTGCPRRNVQYFGRVFLMLNYTDITQNTYIQSWTVTEIMAR